MERYPTPDIDKYAGVLDRRFEALLLDSLLVAIVVGGLGYLGGIVVGDGSLAGIGGALLAVQFGLPVVLPLYQIICEGYSGQTPGKSLRGIVVVNEYGSDISWGAAVIRNLLRIVDILPGFYIVGIVAAYTNDQNKRVGDMVANTVVVYTRN
ncbi:RDD family protein [Haloarchaeobius sp. FL176]|uniref:RDD family protein n=1 Tax=Haloarchaeobius sp. FL176 TaxID=2967129 RepID=UPI002148E6F9|nr:RDD family protein [Haloarchaeobius sp. FL176]